MAQSLVWAFSSILNAHGQTRLTMANSLTMNIGNALLSLYLVTHTDYQLAEVETLAMKLDQARQEILGPAVTLQDAAHGASKQHMRHLEGRFGSQWRRTDQARNPAGRENVEGRAQNLGAARGV